MVIRPIPAAIFSGSNLCETLNLLLGESRASQRFADTSEALFATARENDHACNTSQRKASRNADGGGLEFGRHLHPRRRAAAQIVSTTWIGSAGNAGNGSWQTASDWSGGAVPNNGTPPGSSYNVFIDGGNATASNVTLFLNQAYTVNNINISSGDTLTVTGTFNNGAGEPPLTIQNGGSLFNSGTLALNFVPGLMGGEALVGIEGTVTFSGGGTVTTNIQSANGFAKAGIVSPSRLINVDNHFMVKGGDLGGVLLTNQSGGIVDVISNNVFTISASNGVGFNSGLIRVDGGGHLTLQSTGTGSWDNTSGTIRADSSAGNPFLALGGIFNAGTIETVGSGVGTIDIFAATTITNGNLINNATGVLEIDSHGTFSGSLTNAGSVMVTSNGTGLATLNILGGSTINNSGQMMPFRVPNGSVTLNGTGAVTLTGNWLTGTTADTTRLVNNSKIDGAGYLCNDGTNGQFMSLTNTGVVDADVAGGSLTIYDGFLPVGDVTNTTGTFTSTAGTLILRGPIANNTGGRILTNGGTTLLQDGTITNTGTIAPGSTGTLAFGSVTINNNSGGYVFLNNNSANGSTFTAGTINNNAGGTIRVQSGIGTLGGTVINAVNGILQSNGGTFVLLSSGSLTDHGQINLLSGIGGGSLTAGLLISGGTESFTGGGEVFCGGAVIGGVAGTEKLINVDHTIDGQANLGNNSLSILNQSTGTISSSGSTFFGANFTIDPNASGMVNQGLLKRKARAC